MGCCGNNKISPEEQAKRDRDDPNFKGPVSWKKRRCRDLHCCALYAGLWFGLIIVMALAFEKGDPLRLWYGHDSFGNTCGRSDNKNLAHLATGNHTWPINSGLSMKNNKHLMYYYASAGTEAIQMCAQQCPRADQVNPDTFAFDPVPSSTGWCINDDTGCALQSGNFETAATTTATTANTCVDTSALCIYVPYPSSLVSASASGSGSGSGTAVTAAAATVANECLKVYNGQNVSDLCPATCEICNGTTTTTTTTATVTSSTVTTTTATTISTTTTTQCTTPYNPYHFDQFQTTTPKVDSRGCPTEVWGSTMIMNRCVPTGATVGAAARSVINAIDGMGIIGNILNDFQEATESLIILFVLCIVASLIVVFCLQYIAKCLIWTVYCLLFVGSCLLLAFLWIEWDDAKSDNDAARRRNETVTGTMQENEDLYFGLAITWSIIGGLLIIFLIYIFNTIRLVVAIFKEAGKVVRSSPLILFYPIFTFCWSLVIIGYFLWVFFYLWTAGDPKVHNSSQHITFDWDEDLRGWLWYHLFGFFWTYELNLAFQEAVVAGVAAEWYFTAWKDPKTTQKKMPMRLPILSSMARMIRFSFGSLIAGAMIIAVVKLIRFFVSFVEEKIKKAAGKNIAVKCVFKIVNCCLWCVEKCLKFLNRNAYIEIAMYGDNFCSSAQSAFAILMRNAIRVSAINSVGDAVLWLCKMVITIGAIIGAFYWFRHSDDDLNYEAFMILFVGCFAYYVACMFIGVFEMIIDTIFMCFCEDAERNDPTKGEGFDYYMSRDLLSFMAASERRAQKKHAKERQIRQEHRTKKDARKSPNNPGQFNSATTPVTPIASPSKKKTQGETADF